MSIHIPSLLISACLFTGSAAHAVTGSGTAPRPGPAQEHSHAEHLQKPLDFTENKGQWTSEAKYKADIPGGAVFITDRGFVYHYISGEDLRRIHEDGFEKKGDGKADAHDGPVHGHAYRVSFIGANTDCRYSTSEKRKYYSNYIMGNDPAGWAGNVGLFGRIVRHDVYPGIDVAIYSKGTSLKYDFIISPGADVHRIALSFDGVQPEVTEAGDLRLRTSVNEVIERAPYCYQVIDHQEIAVPARYRLAAGRLTFELLQGYDARYPLVIDPELVYITYSGATGGANYSYTSTYDGDGNMYIGADAWMAGWPVTMGAYQTTYANGAHEVAINKYNKYGSDLVFSTYYGGIGWDVPHALLVNAQNELIVAGSTTSPDLPVTPGCYAGAPLGDMDLFVARFNAAGSALMGATYVGGSGEEPMLLGLGANVVAVTASVGNTIGMTPPVELTLDAAGNIWVVSNTKSVAFPTTPGAAQPTFSGGSLDGVIFKLDPACSQLLYSSYIGGKADDIASAILFTPDSNLIIAGSTNSPDFRTTAGTLHPAAPGGYMDGFVLVMDQSGAVLHATYIGTNKIDMAEKVQTDCSGNVYVLGRTSGNYPISAGVYRTYTDGGIFLDKLAPDLSASLVSTRLGGRTAGNPSVYPSAFMLDKCGDVYLAGLAINYTPTDLPVTANAFQSTAAAFWFCRVGAGFSALKYGSFFGMTGDHTHPGVHRIDPEGFLYHSICNNSTYPYVTPAAYAPVKQTTGQDVLSFRFDFEPTRFAFDLDAPGGAGDTAAHCVRGCKPAYVHVNRVSGDTGSVTIRYLISGTAVNGVDYRQIADSVVIPAGQQTAAIEIAPLPAPAPTGVREAVISILAPCSCPNSPDTIGEVRVLIYDSLYVRMITPPDTVCPNTVVTITAETDSTLQYTWEPAALIPDPLPLGFSIHPAPSATQTYSITVTQPGAPATCPPRTQRCEVFVESLPELTILPGDTTVCDQFGFPVRVLATPPNAGYRYEWSPPAYLSGDITRADNEFRAPAGDYEIWVKVTTPLASCSVADTIRVHVVPGFRFESVSPADTVINYGDRVLLSASGGAVAWHWTPAHYLEDPSAPTTFAAPPEDIIYTLVGHDRYGCSDTVHSEIKVVFNPVSGIPNAFSPNGDGLNDVFRVANLKFERVKEFRVFNRFGQLVYSGNPTTGWDGMYNGEPAPLGVYYYSILLVLPDDTELPFKGDFTLVR